MPSQGWVDVKSDSSRGPVQSALIAGPFELHWRVSSCYQVLSKTWFGSSKYYNTYDVETQSNIFRRRVI